MITACSESLGFYFVNQKLCSKQRHFSKSCFPQELLYVTDHDKEI